MYNWRDRLAVLGVAAGCVLAAKALRQLLLWSEINLLPPNIHNFKGEWALVTGASEGVGKAIGAELAKHGLNVVLVSRSQAKLDAAAAEITSKHKVKVTTYAIDVTERQNLDSLLQHLSDTNTHISVLVANAGGGVSRIAAYWDYTDQEHEFVQNLNGQACYVLVRALLPAMIQRGKGAVVAISSVSSRIGAYLAPYGAEKAKVNALCTSLDLELHGTGVTAQAMVLGAVITPGYTGFFNPAAVTELKPSVALPTAETAAAAVIKCIGKGGPVVTPYWGHSLVEYLSLDIWWPPVLKRTVHRTVTRQIKAQWEAKQAAVQT